MNDNRNSPTTPCRDYGGLTKLEYAVIQIIAGGQSIPGRHNEVGAASIDAVRKANGMFDALEHIGVGVSDDETQIDLTNPISTTPQLPEVKWNQLTHDAYYIWDTTATGGRYSVVCLNHRKDGIYDASDSTNVWYFENALVGRILGPFDFPPVGDES